MELQRCFAKRLCVAVSQVRAYSAPAERSIPAAKQKYVPTSGTYPKGFLAGSSHAGVKASNTKYDDIALVVSEQPCTAAGVFTQNVFKAAPVEASKSLLKTRAHEGLRGVVVNSGCANAVTGELGRAHATEMAKATDQCFDASSAQDLSEDPRTLVMSTGVIGQRLPIDKIKHAIPKAHAALGSTHDDWMNAAQAICTTDTFPKLLSRTFTLPSHPSTEYRIAGMTKGAGMIHPNMGTLLGIICTDVKVHPAGITSVLRHATNSSFNMISIDGDTSTNDTVALLANGAAAPAEVKPLEFRKHDYSEDSKAFLKVLREFMVDLAKLVVRDGEGATKFVAIRVISDENSNTARRVASSIATSSLVKTALYGKDANWGRILCAVGYTPGTISNLTMGFPAPTTSDGKPRRSVIPSRTSVSFVPADGSEVLELLVKGEPQEVDEVRAKAILEMEDLEILVRLEHDEEGAERSRERHEAVFWTCDFSHEYVTINGDYRT